MKESGVAVVIGAGTMGGGIAADLANAGWSVHLLDVTAEHAGRGLSRLRTARPPLLFVPENIDRISIGGTQDMGVLRQADWIIEAVAEKLEIKRAVLARVEAYASPGAIVTSNTSGLSLAGMSAHLNEAFRKRFFGTHFLNPPRYLKLLELIPTPDTDRAILNDFFQFAEHTLGHRCVIAKDTPGFISTRLWIAHLMDSIHTAIEMGVDVETVDFLTGPFIGRPGSATFRMADLVGLDIVLSVARNQYESLPDDPLRHRLPPPEVLQRLIAAGFKGDKTGAGFYRREKDGQVLVLDLKELKYRPRRAVTEPNHPYLNTILDTFFGYVHQIRPQIAEREWDIDHVFQWGFGWNKGPLTMDAERRGAFLPSPPPDTEYIELDHLAPLQSAPTATLRDMGDGIACIEFHTKMNVFSPELLELLLSLVERAEREFLGLVIGNQGAHFSAGYDLARLVAAMERGDLKTIDTEMALCQKAFQKLKYARLPIVAAPHGFALGAGGECVLHCTHVHAAAETYLGLPEVAVGVIPCGGGVKETLLRLGDGRAALEAILFNQNSTSAYDAIRQKRLRDTDTVARNADRRLYEAKLKALELSDSFQPTQPDDVTPPTVDATLLKSALDGWQAEGKLSEIEYRIGEALLHVLAGGPNDEASLLTREREAFQKLCQEPLSLARMRHMLQTNRPLKN
jgi:3-hydroxyacyl-CoA dehydrogenase